MSDVIDELRTKYFKDLPIKPIAKRITINLLLGYPLSPPEIVDYGIDSEEHYHALRAVVKANDEDDKALRRVVVELDEAYGNGKLLEALVKKYAPHYADKVRFSTSWDAIFGRDKAI